MWVIGGAIVLSGSVRGGARLILAVAGLSVAYGGYLISAS